MVRSATLRLAYSLGRASVWLYGLSFRFHTYPTRSGEALVAWMTLMWSGSILAYPEMMQGAQFDPMRAILSPNGWGAMGAAFATFRLVALISNGHWRPSPELRLVGAIYSAMFWIALSYCYYAAVANGAPDFPFRRVLYVVIGFEFYACLWIGHDIHVQDLKFKARRLSGLTGRAGNG